MSISAWWKLGKNTADHIWEKIIILAGALYVLLPTSPLNMPFPDRDSGVFLYIGWRILNGELPYRDIWDHKPPVIFYINALGLAILNNSRWGIWLIELIALLTGAYLSVQLMKKGFGFPAAIISLSLWLITLALVLSGGNLTTEYTLPLQFLALWLIQDVDESKYKNWRYFLIGLTGGIAFFTKQTTIGIWIALVGYLIIWSIKSNSPIRDWIHKILIIFIGGLFISALIIIYFFMQRGLSQLWDAAFRYNLAYSLSANGLSGRLTPVISGAILLTKTGLFEISMAGYILALFHLHNIDAYKWSRLIYIGLIDYPIEWILVSASGRTYPHYYMTLLPCLTLFSAFCFWFIASCFSGWNISNIARKILIADVIFLFLAATITAYKNIAIGYKNIVNAAVIGYIKRATSPDSYVLLWGAETTINFYSQRRSPTRYVYQYPLYTPGYVEDQMIEEFLTDLINKKPPIIVDTKNPDTPIFGFPIQSQTINEEVAILESRYRAVDNVGNWTVYEYIKTP